MIFHSHGGDYLNAKKEFVLMKEQPLRTTRHINDKIHGNIQNIDKNSPFAPSNSPSMSALSYLPSASRKSNPISKSLDPKNVIASVTRNVVVLTDLACAAFYSDRIDDAAKLFKSIRTFNPQYLYQLDVYAEVLFVQEETAELAQLADEVITLSGGRLAAGWIMMGLLCELRNEHDRSLVFYDKVQLLLLS